MIAKSFLETRGFPPEGDIFPVKGVRLPVQEGEHPWIAVNRADIAENWIAESWANPSLYDGEMVFQRRLDFIDGTVEGRAHLVPFSAFLHWRRSSRGPGGCHLFGLPVIVSSDGAVIAIRMGRHTANPGRVYCAAGSMDRDDIVDGHCDVDLNMRREVQEETGFRLEDAVERSGYYAVHGMNTVSIFRIFRFDLTAEAMLTRIEAHAATEEEPEIDGAVSIWNADPEAHDYAFFMPPILKFLFEDQNPIQGRQA